MRRVLMSDELFDALGASKVEWGEPDAEGFYTPTVYADTTEATLRAAGEGYEVRVWQRHEPSGVVVLKGHPQLGGRYCLTDGGDWPCATVRAALEQSAVQPEGGPE